MSTVKVAVIVSKCFEQPGAQWPSQTCSSSNIDIAVSNTCEYYNSETL
jgi:hypothetical protein